MLILVSLALAAEPEAERSSSLLVGGGVSGAAGVVGVDGGLEGVVGLPQVEGDVGVRAGAFAMRVDLDASLWLPGGSAVVALVPEQAWIRVGGSKVYLAAGSMVGPFQPESVDPWDRALHTRSAVARHGLPDHVGGVSFGSAGSAGRVEALAVVDLGDGINLVAPPDTWAPQAPFLLAGRGEIGSGMVTVGAGALYRPTSGTGAVEIDAQVVTPIVRVDGQVLAGLGAPHAATVGVEVTPRFVIAPAARVGWYGDAPEGALGVAIRPLPFVRLGVEAAWSDGAPGAWVSAEVFAPGTSRRTGDGGDPSGVR